MEIESYHTCNSDLKWHGLYGKDGKWKKYLASETNKHPAKMSMALADRIMIHLEQLGYLHEGDRIIDFMCGTSRTGVVAELHGYSFTGIELESHFIDMINGSECDGSFKTEDASDKDHVKVFYGQCRAKEIHQPHHINGNRDTLQKAINHPPSWNIIQGDARHLSELLQSNGAGIVSPPYGDTGLNYRENGLIVDGKKYHRPYMDGNNIGYSGVISPAYADMKVGKYSKGIDSKKNYESYRKSGGGMSYEAFVKYMESQSNEYSSNPDNVSNLKDIGLVSPVYGEMIKKNGGTMPDDYKVEVSTKTARKYSDNPSNIGNLKDIGIVSPPYGDALTHPSLGSVNKPEWGKGGDIVGRRGLTKKYESVGSKEINRNGDNIGNLKDIGIVSPPYANIEIGKGMNTRPSRPGHKDQTGRSENAVSQQITKYSENSFNIGNLKDVGIVSPPYAMGEGTGHGGIPTALMNEKRIFNRYGTGEEQIGNRIGETYLSAMHSVYSEAFNSGISPLVTVTKNPTKQGKLRRLDIDTILLLEKAGYQIIDYHQAMLFTEHKQQTLSGDEIKGAKGQMSFFKRLSYSKGNAVADHEDIIIAVIPEGGMNE